MKKKLIGTVLSFALGISGILFAGYPMSAQAAKPNDIALASDCSHVWAEPADWTSDEYYVEANSGYHFIYVDKIYYCARCSQAAKSQEQTGYEEHSMVAGAPSPYRDICLKCGHME